MLANIVLAGGGCKMRNLVTKVYELLHEHIESILPDCKDAYIKIIESPKAVEPADLPWRGAAIIGSTRNEISYHKDMWIPRDQFIKHGPKVLKTYLPFTI
jgi:actin-related protein